jgi:hypothetical protein
MKCTLLALFVALLPTAAFAQGPAPQALPIAIDMQKVPVGTWAEYSMTFGEMKLKSRWALVARDAKSNTLEMSMDGAGPGGAKMALKMVLVPDPTASENPVKEMIMQVGDADPMLAPPNAPVQKFQKPDPKTLVGKEDIKVPAGTFKTSHYRQKAPVGTIDVWLSEEAAPLGLVRVVTTPDAKAAGPDAPPVGPATMELVAAGKDAKPTITKPAKPFDPAKFMGGGGAPSSDKPVDDNKSSKKGKKK